MEGIDEILLTALQKPEDRALVLDFEAQVTRLVADQTGIRRLEFPPMNSYRRLLLHRLAAYYRVSHVIAPEIKDVVVLYREDHSAVPSRRLADVAAVDAGCGTGDEEQANVRIIRRRMGSGQAHAESESDERLCNRAPKSIEEREAEYMRARAEIFEGAERLSAGGQSGEQREAT